MDPPGNPKPTNVLDESRHEKLKYSRWALVPVLFCYVFGSGMNAYIVPEYIQHTVEQSYQFNQTGSNGSGFPNVDQNDTNARVQEECARWNIYLDLATQVPAIFMSIILGSYSDVIGRKILIAINLCGTLIQATFVALIIKLELDLFYFIIGNLIDGFTGSFTTLLAFSFSYISDLTKAGNQRTLFIVLLELTLALAITGSVISVGYFIDLAGFFLPSLTGTVTSLLAIVITVVAVPETLERNRHTMGNTVPTEPTGPSRLLQIAKNIWSLYFGQNDKKNSVKYVVLMLAFTFTCITQFSSMDTLYQLGEPFCWSATRIGWYGTIKIGLSSTVGLLSAYLLKKFMADECVAAIGIVSLLLGLIVEAVATTNTMLYLVLVVGILSALPIPMLRSLMSHMTSSDMQGTLFASIGTVETVCMLVGSLTSNAVYAATLKIMNGFVFLVVATYALVALVFIICFMVVKRCGPDEPMLLQQDGIEDNDIDDVSVDLNIPA